MKFDFVYISVLVGVIVGFSRTLQHLAGRQQKRFVMIMFLGEITTCGLTTLLGAVLALEYLPGVTEMTAIALSGVASHLGVRNFFVYFFSRYGITVTPSAFLRPPHDKPPG